MFWHVDDAAFKIEKTLREIPEHIETTRKRVGEGRLPESDLQLLIEASRHMCAPFIIVFERQLSYGQRDCFQGSNLAITSCVSLRILEGIQYADTHLQRKLQSW